MTLLDDLVATPLAAAIGWTLLHSLWQGALVALTLAALLLPARSPRLRYAAACAAMLVFSGAVLLTFLYLLPESRGALHSLRPPALPPSSVPFAPASAVPGLTLTAVAPWLTPFWMVGFLLFGLRQAAGFFALHRLRRHGLSPVPVVRREELSRLSARMRVSRPVRLAESWLVEAPVVLGHFRPLILVPAGLLAGLPAAHLEAMLLHELAHVRRSDYLVNALARFVEGLLFYHPAVWWFASLIRTEREHCCDDAVVVSLDGNAYTYAQALASLAQLRGSAHQPALAATAGSLVRRVRRLLYPPQPHGAWAPWLAALLLVSTAALALAARQPESALAFQVAAAAANANLPDRYSTWLNQDVVYIIQPAERAAFLRLHTNPERDRFIEQFWLRRDPTPDTAENEFKEEHYRRVAFANQHFHEPSGAPGWRTDRGRTYIVDGPPDEIDAHPRGGQYAYATQVWTYRHAPPKGREGSVTFTGRHAPANARETSITFTDRPGHGEYRMTPTH